MAKKITELVELTAIATGDLFIVEDISTSTTKKITWDNLVDDASITTAKIADGAVTPGKLLAGAGTSWAWQEWTPTWTNLTVGNGTVVSRYTKIGKTIHGFYSLVFGSTSSVSGPISFTLPVTATTLSGQTPIGVVYIDNTGVESYQGVVMWLSTTTANFFVPNGSSDTRLVAATTNKPIAAYGTGDSIKFTFTHEAA